MSTGQATTAIPVRVWDESLAAAMKDFERHRDVASIYERTLDQADARSEAATQAVAKATAEFGRPEIEDIQAEDHAIRHAEGAATILLQQEAQMGSQLRKILGMENSGHVIVTFPGSTREAMVSSAGNAFFVTVNEGGKKVNRTICPVPAADLLTTLSQIPEMSEQAVKSLGSMQARLR